jgi:hypothetical protein
LAAVEVVDKALIQILDRVVLAGEEALVHLLAIVLLVLMELKTQVGVAVAKLFLTLLLSHRLVAAQAL